MDLKNNTFLSSLNCDKKVDLERVTTLIPSPWAFNDIFNKIFILFTVTCIFFYTKIIHLSYKSKLRLLNQAPKTEDTSPCLLQKNYPSQKKYVTHIDLQFLILGFVLCSELLCVISKWEFFIKMRAVCLLPSSLHFSSFLVEGGSKAGSSHFNEKFSF